MKLSEQKGSEKAERQGQPSTPPIDQTAELSRSMEKLRKNIKEFHIDLTGHKQSEETWRAAEAKFHNLIAGSVDGIVVVNKDGIIRFFNPAAEALWGRKSGELVGNVFGHPVAKDAFTVLDIVSTSGKVSLAEMRAAEILWEEEICYLVSLRDVTERERLVKEVEQRTQELTRSNEELQGQIEARHQAEAALRESRDYLEKLFDCANAPIIVWDPGFLITRFNRAFECLTGYSAAEAIGQKLHLLFPEASRDESFAKLARTLMGEQWESVEIPILRKDGESRLALWNSANILDDGGNLLVATIAQGQDITERKHAEESLRASQEKFRDLVETINDWVWEVDANGVYTYVSPRVKELLGYEPGEVLGKTPFDYMPREEAQRVAELFRDLAAEKKPFLSLENVNLHKDGRRVVLDTSGLPLFDAQGNLRGYRGIDRDITQRQAGEESLRASEARYRSLVENIDLGISLISSEHRIIMTNAYFAKLFRKSPGELVDKECFRAFEKREAVCPHCPGVQAMASGQVAEVETEGVRDDGSRFPVRIHAFPVLNTYGKVTGFIEVLEDITEHKRMAESVHRREAILECLTLSAKQFLQSSSWQDGVEEMLTRLGQATGVNRAYVYENYAAPDGPLMTSIRYEWAAPGATPRLGNPVSHHFAYRAQGFARWEEALGQGQIIHGPTREFPERERKYFASQGIHSLAVVPIFVGKEWWGFIGFEDFQSDREWLPVELDTLKAAASQLSSAMQRTRTEEELRGALEKLQQTLANTIGALGRTLELRDLYTAGHQRRVTLLACEIAREMGLSAEQIEIVHLAGLVHDVGKIYVPAEILAKPAKLKDIEMNMIKNHPQAGYEILQGIEFDSIAEIVYQHHERMDGSGYPKGLAGQDTHLEARIIAVADVVEAMSSHRPYRVALGVDKALEEISQNKGILYDPEAVAACLRLFREKGFKFDA